MDPVFQYRIAMWVMPTFPSYRIWIGITGVFSKSFGYVAVGFKASAIKVLSISAQ